jgi:hypothetical protein
MSRFFYLISLKGIGFDVILPIIVSCNVGAIFMAENLSSGVRTRHTNTRYHFVHQHFKEGLIKIVFVNSSNHDADMLIKMWERKHMNNI